jgi:hypothetical protein
LRLITNRRTALLAPRSPTAGPFLAGSCVVFRVKRYYARLRLPLRSLRHPRRVSPRGHPVPGPTVRTFHLGVPSGPCRGVLDGCASKVFPASLAFDAQRAPAARTRLPLVPRRCLRGFNLTTRQSSRNATDRAFARPPCEDFVSGLHRRDFARRCRSATRRLGPYLGRTFTGKPDQAYLDTRSGC